MAGALMSGKLGKVVWNAEDGGSDVDFLHIQTWTLDATADVADQTAMGDTSRTYLGGFTDWTAMVECNQRDGEPQVLYATSGANDGLGEAYETGTTQKVFIELWFGENASDGLIYGPAIAIGISHTTDMNDVIKVTYAFQGNGEILYKETEPTDFEEPLS